MISKETLDNTRRRLAEVRTVVYRSPRHSAIMKTLDRMAAKLNATERRILDKWEPLEIGYISNPLRYADPLCWLPIRDHAAIVKLIQLGYLTVERSPNPQTGYPLETIVKVDHED